MHPFEDLVVPKGSVGIHWFGQSTLGLKDPQGTIVQVDPYYPRERPADRFVHARPPLNEESLRTDYVLLTHDHGDHTCIESIERIVGTYPDVRFVGPEESIKHIRTSNIDNDSVTVTAGDTAELGTMTAHTVYAKPPAGLPDDGIDPPDVNHLGYVVEAGGVRIYISGDPVNTFFQRHCRFFTEILPGYVRDMSRTFPGNFQDTSGICSRIAEDMSGIHRNSY